MTKVNLQNIPDCPSDHSKQWKVTSIAQDSSILPTIAVSIWTTFALIGVCFTTYMSLLAPWNAKILFLVYVLTVYLTMDVHSHTSTIFSSKNSIYIVIGILAIQWNQYSIALMALSSFLPREFPGSLGKTFGNWIMIQSAKYFALKTTLEDEESLQHISEKGTAAIFALEPHDILPFGALAFSSALKRFPPGPISDSTLLVTSAIFATPFLKHTSTWLHGGPIDKTTFRRMLTRGKTAVIIPGGVQEVIVMNPEKPEQIALYLNKRKGFVKLALEYGSPIVPAFAFHVDGSYGYLLPRGKWIKNMARKIGFLPLLFWGRFGIPFGIPRPRKLHVVIGKPIDIPCEGLDVKEKSVSYYHGIFVKELQALFERHKVAEGYEHRTLVIV